MKRAQRLEPVRHLIDDVQRQLAQRVATCERKVAEAETKLEELQRYRSEYETQLAQRAGQGIGASDLRDYQAFLARLNEAIRQQQGVIRRVQSERDAERLQWQEAVKRAKALGHVVEQWQAEERRSSERRDQRESDDRAQRKVTLT